MQEVSKRPTTLHRIWRGSMKAGLREMKRPVRMQSAAAPARTRQTVLALTTLIERLLFTPGANPKLWVAARPSCRCE